MKNQYHVLNGDALAEQFPESIPGKVFVVRECLIDGIVQENDVDIFFQKRARFIKQRFEGCSEEIYYQKTVSEFKKIQNIPTEDEINLWFEDDLFCQTNCWFVIYLISQDNPNQSIYLVQPNEINKYNFGNMTELELFASLKRKTFINSFEIQKFSALWESYQVNDVKSMFRIAKELGDKYLHLTPVIKAHEDRIPKKNFPGRPTQSLVSIMNELNTNEFGLIFQEFCKREGIYGLGDLQVKQLIDGIKKANDIV